MAGLEKENASEKEKERAEVGPSRHPDPLTGESGAHPFGTGVGAVAGAAAAAGVGAAVGGPAGALVGAAVGAIAGGGIGKAAAEALDPVIEGSFWRENYHQRPYIEPGTDFSAWEPAYRYGWESAVNPEWAGRTFDQAEPELERRWNRQHSASRAWPSARPAVRDAWVRIRGGTKDSARG